MAIFFVYILKSLAYNKYYTVYTYNLSARLNKHNQGKNTYTSRFTPWEVAYTERFVTKQEAIAREKYLKSAAGRR